MIVPMKHLDLVCLASEKDATLERLRGLGAVHLDLAAAGGASVAAAEGELADAEKAVRLVQKARKDEKAADGAAAKQNGDTAGRGGVPPPPASVADVLSLDTERAKALAEADRLEKEIRVYEPFGDFDPALAAKLRETVKGLDDVVPLPAKLPEMRLSKMKELYAAARARAAEMTREIASVDDAAILAEYPEIRDRIMFERAKELLSDRGELAVLSGWIPETRVEALMKEVHGSDGDLFARSAKIGWAVLLREPADGETPPTLIEPPRFFKSVKSLFEGLGVAPAYTESDVSVPFMCYFSLFFAMLVGDGAYGAIFLAATLYFRKKMPHSWFILMTVFSSATVLWGVLSNTWFGAGIPFLANLPTVQWLADPSYNNMMFLCFTIGVSHLMLARCWNGVCKLPDSTAIAEFGWAGILLMMYLVTNSIVGIFAGFPKWGYCLGGISIAAVFLFSVKPSELKTRGAELGMLPLNIMSALGDIISYVRLFAVGLASVKVAENFNNMAIGLFEDASSWWVKGLMAVAMVAILVFGHVLNLMMAGLSILVHAVRLNTLEFSNHKGITWSGLAFNPFRKLKTN